MVQFICQSALVLDWIGGGGLRTYFRAATFFSSLAMLGFLPGRSRHPHPVRLTAIAALIWMGIGLLHSNANPVSGIAHWLLNIAVWAPLFWTSRIFCTARTIHNTLVMLWLFNVLASIIGVLQVYYPERFSPSAEFIRNVAGVYADGLLIERTDGKQVWRPCGLSDTPGGAANSGSFAVVVGIVMFSVSNRRSIRLMAAIGILAGVFCIYVCEIRSILIITVLSAVILTTLQLMQGRLTRAAAMLLLIPLVAAAGIAWTKSISGERVGERIRTLTATSASNVYYQNRGVFLEHSLFEELPKYPLGAGLGRYGMMFLYFGDPTIPGANELWVEIQLTGWLYDGGLPLILLGYGAVIATCYVTYKVAVSPKDRRSVADYAAVVTALNAGWLAVTFNSPFFNSQQGMIFWLLNAVIYFVSISENYRTGSRTKPLRQQIDNCATITTTFSQPL